ncbi:MAG: hypothetical protein HGGPFJEG_00998 [Ignavibacteria bacterium]|nr:hypothetical protein [Ignavibacteria bacterium]
MKSKIKYLETVDVGYLIKDNIERSLESTVFILIPNLSSQTLTYGKRL